MSSDAEQLPSDPRTLRRMLIAERAARAASEAELAAAKAGLQAKTLEIEKLKIQIARLRRQQFGRSSEKIARVIEQLELMLDELETEAAAAGPQVIAMPAAAPESDPPLRQKSPGRRPLPEHLPRTEIVHQPGEVCPACSSPMRKVGEDVTEILDYIPGRFQVIRHVRPALSCRSCERMAQMPMPSLPVERGRRRRSAGAYSGGQVLRSPAVVPPSRHLCPRRCRSRPGGDGGLGRQIGLAFGADRKS